ncbi:hypothetical protein GIB67_014180 [Kingdonia uniflora]|uniref:NADH-plastoquinone oxidoreductase subunit 2 n=1 Tax=Kingdonia uniflora TaxID=39325 RepID=A0A7J7NWQ3_9MAGN|nr:hypothetical protein GIB67_014180 [Kingdonia uniflora]
MKAFHLLLFNGSFIFPECILIFGLILLLMIDSTSDQKDIPWLYFISSTSLVMSITALLFRWREEPMISFSGNFQTNNFNEIFQFLILLCSTLCIPLSVEYIECTEMAITEFLLFVLTATLGGMFLCGANDLITIFVAPECFSLCSYLLSGYTKRDVRSNEATTKYLLMGGASSSILVHGFSWLYGSSGGEIELQEIVNGLINTQMYNSPGISIALIFITVGIGFKLSPAPSHQWTPDVYEGVRAMTNSKFSKYVRAIVEIARLEAGIMTEESMGFDEIDLVMNHYKEMTEREDRRVIDVVGGEDRDVLKGSRSKSHDVVVTLMREVHPIDYFKHHEV